MHQDSHKIFEAYVLAKNVENQQLNEETVNELFGLGDFLKKRGIEKQGQEKVNLYKDMWLRYWYPRFANKNEIKTNPEKAVDVFQDFLDSKQWADTNIEKNKEQAIEHFKTHHGEDNYQDVEQDVFEILLYGRSSRDPSAKRVSDEPKKKLVSTEGPAVKTPAYKGLSKAEYDKLSPEDRAAHDKRFAKPEDFDKTADHAAAEPAKSELAAVEPEEDAYKLKGEVTRLKNLNQAWINAIKKKFGRTVRKPSDLSGKSKPAAKKSVVGKK